MLISGLISQTYLQFYLRNFIVGLEQDVQPLHRFIIGRCALSLWICRFGVGGHAGFEVAWNTVLLPVLVLLGFRLGRRVATAFKSVRISISVCRVIVTVLQGCLHRRSK